MKKIGKIFLGICLGFILIGMLQMVGLALVVAYLAYKAYEEYKINKFSGKFIAECAGVIVLSLILIAAFTGDTDTTQVVQDDTTTQVDQPVEEPQEDIFEDEITEDPEEDDEMSLYDQIDMAEWYLETVLSQSFGEGNYKIQTEGNNVVVLLNMSRSVLQDGLNNPDEWDKMVEEMKKTNNTFVDGLTSIGCTDIDIAIIAGDFSLDETYLAVKNGIVYYDYVNGINNLE